MEKGTLVEFRLNGERRLAVADRPEGKKHWIVIDERGNAHTLHPRDVTYEVTGERFLASDIPQFWQKTQNFLDPSSLEVAWELLREDGEVVDPPTMAQLLFSEKAAVHCYAAYCLLSDDRVFFKQKGDRYEPRPANQVAEIKHQQAVATQRQQEWQEFLQTCQTLLKQARNSVHATTPCLSESELGDLRGILRQVRYRQRVEALEKFATFGEESNQRIAAQEILVALGLTPSAQSAFQLLVDLGLWTAHENLFVRRSQMPTQFSPEVMTVVQERLASPPPDFSDGHRLDLTHLKVYTIDDESTQEIDDGLSLEQLADDRQRIWVHIADPTRWLSPGDALDLEARRRSTTVYLPTGMLSMFPPELATGPMSLVQGQICHALSFGVVLTAAGAIAEYEIHPSLIRPTYRLTYEDVAEILELGVQAEAEIVALAAWAKKRQQWRIAQGAISISMPESSIKVQGDEITIRLLEDSISRTLVAEMMIMAGEVAGRYGQTHQIAVPFRHQAQPELPSDEELLQLPAGPVRDCAVRRCMPRSELSTTPYRHASLGLDFYTQVTSPIRRYSDLLAHFQIKAHLRGDSLPFSDDEMRELLMGVTIATQEATSVERQTNRYWGLEFLRRHSDQVWEALVLRWLREHENLALVLLEELGLELAMRFTMAVQPGDRLEVRVTYVDPRQDVIQFEERLPQTA